MPNSLPIKVCFIAPKAYPLFNPDIKQVFGGAEVDMYMTATELAKDKNFKVSFIVADNARKPIMDKGYDPVFGARPLKRTIQQKLENPLTSEMLAGKFAGGDTVKIDAGHNKFTFEKI